jgi:hypothetical protein
MDYNTTRLVSCVVCGRNFKDDCGDVVCSSSCEKAYEHEYAECERCGDEVGKDNLNNGICENCQDELENEDQ